MSCQVQINTINQLKSKNIIDDFSLEGKNKILNTIEFDKLNEKYTQFAKAKYPNLVIPDGELLFETDITDNEKWAVPNKNLFAKLEYEKIDFGSKTVSDVKFSPETEGFKIGIGYKF